ncbi:MAG: D-alanyl-D-alanine carboxypeptidase/D-alanyl-D-alanine-endopeptidase [Nitrospinae bacterium]|nr:D-alanyl-D-alanine carboxypeptidase/D-alanyl-D-alanine-endopeptidase [Nitrospinota bacterium]
MHFAFFSSPAFSIEHSDLNQKPVPASLPSNASIGGIKQGIDHILNDRCLKDSKVGIKIVSLDTGEVVYERNSDGLLMPASNMKLITTAAALSKLRPDYKFKTIVAHDGEREGNVIHGNLYIKGYGDPKLVTEELLLIVRNMKNLGIKVISGDIIADDSFFDSERIGNGWKADEDSRAYNAKIGALSLNFNTISVFVGSDKNDGVRPMVITNPPTNFVEIVNNAVIKKRRVGTTITVNRIEGGRISNGGGAFPDNSGDSSPKGLIGDKIIVNGEVSAGKKKFYYYRNISNPPLYTATVFREFIEKEGISVKGSLKSGIMPENAEEILSHESVPLSLIVRDLNKMSNNFIAEQILKTMGAEIKGAPGTAEKGLSVIEEYLEDIGIQKGQYRIADGSGLSKLNLLTTSQIIKILEVMYNDFTLQSEYTASLSVMGIDGSLKKRMNGSSLEGMVRGKTGTLDEVSAISGYAAIPPRPPFKKGGGGDLKGELFAFSIIMNDFRCDVGKIWNIQNQIISVLTK